MISGIFALILTVGISYGIRTESTAMSSSQDNTILDNHAIIQSLQVAQSQGVNIAIHGWKHENYSELSSSQSEELLDKSKAVFVAANFTSGTFISPFEMSGVKDTNATLTALKTESLDDPFEGATVYEYTWEWRDMTSIADPRYTEAIAQVNIDKPAVLVLHIQDFNPFTISFIEQYLANSSKPVYLRMDDIDVNTNPQDIANFTKLSNYKNVCGAMLAVIPAGYYSAGEDPIRDGVHVNSIMALYFIFFIFSALLPMSFLTVARLLAGRKDKKQKQSNSSQPELVTVIVPAYNEEKSIARCIESLLKQDYTGAKEIIVVNDGSTDRTPHIIPQYPVRFLDLKKNGGKANALNQALKIAQGDIILFSDGDSNMDSQAVRHVVQALQDNPDADMVTGNVLVNMPEKASLFVKLFTRCQQVEYHVEQNVARAVQAMNGGVLVAPGPITACRSYVCDKVKFSDNTVVEDADFTVDALIEGFKVIRCPEAQVYTNAPETIKSWIKQRDRWWFGNLQVWSQHKAWAIKNPWMVYNYIGFILSTLTVVMMLAIPFLLAQYYNPLYVGLISIEHMSIPIIVYIAFNAIFFRHDVKLIPYVIPYIVLYSMLRITIATKLYLCYITGIGMKIKFGSRTIDAQVSSNVNEV